MRSRPRPRPHRNVHHPTPYSPAVMLNKVRARHGIELPVESWEKRGGFAGTVLVLAVLFVLLPLLGVIIKGITTGHLGITAIGIVSLFVALLGSALFLRG